MKKILLQVVIPSMMANGTGYTIELRMNKAVMHMCMNTARKNFDDVMDGQTCYIHMTHVQTCRQTNVMLSFWL